MTKLIPLNWRMMAHPVNWFTVLLMVLIAGFALDIINSWWAQQNATAE